MICGKWPQTPLAAVSWCAQMGPHLMGYEAGFSSRQLRFGFLAVLCGCECHSTCPLAGRDRVPGTARPEECTCEATLRARSSEGQGSGGDDLPSELMDELRLYREAVESVRPFSRGKSSAEVQELLIRELRSRSVSHICRTSFWIWMLEPWLEAGLRQMRFALWLGQCAGWPVFSVN